MRIIGQPIAGCLSLLLSCMFLVACDSNESARSQVRRNRLTTHTVAIGLALSGGGFRAAGFHLGVLQELDRRALLDEVDVISCVSGGCIAAAVLAYHWTRPDRLEVLEEYLSSGNRIAIRSILTGILRPGATRIDQLVEAYDKDLFQGATLSSLSSGPRIYINATNVANGTRFFFASGNASGGPWNDISMRDQTVNACPAESFPLAKALAASSAFPPFFNPLRVENDCLRAQGQDYVSLADGGIYDNLGYGPFIYEINQWLRHLEFVILSDGGKPFPIPEKAPTSGPGVLGQMHNIQMANIRGLGLQLLIDHYCSYAGPRPIFFSIDSDIGEDSSGDAKFASAIETDLRGLGDREMEILKRHGAALLRDRLAYFAPDISGNVSAPTSICQTKFAQGDIGGIFAWDRPGF